MFVEPRAFEVLQRQVEPATQGQRIDRKLDVSVLLLFRLGLVIEDMQIAVTKLEKIDMSRDDVAIEGKLESPTAVVPEVTARQVNRNLDGDGYGIVDQHETLQRLVAFFVCR